jgi:hypothetical protein
MTNCECCKKEIPEPNIFIYDYNNHKYKVCGVCYTNIEEYLLNGRNIQNPILTKKEIEKIQLHNEQENLRIKNLDLTIYPRQYLEKLLDYIRKNDFNTFKKLIKKYNKENNINNH